MVRVFPSLKSVFLVYPLSIYAIGLTLFGSDMDCSFVLVGKPDPPEKLIVV